MTTSISQYVRKKDPRCITYPDTDTLPYRHYRVQSLHSRSDGFYPRYWKLNYEICKDAVYQIPGLKMMFCKDYQDAKGSQYTVVHFIVEDAALNFTDRHAELMTFAMKIYDLLDYHVYIEISDTMQDDPTLKHPESPDPEIVQHYEQTVLKLLPYVQNILGSMAIAIRLALHIENDEPVLLILVQEESRMDWEAVKSALQSNLPEGKCRGVEFRPGSVQAVAEANPQTSRISREINDMEPELGKSVGIRTRHEGGSQGVRCVCITHDQDGLDRTYDVIVTNCHVTEPQDEQLCYDYFRTGLGFNNSYSPNQGDEQVVVSPTQQVIDSHLSACQYPMQTIQMVEEGPKPNWIRNYTLVYRQRRQLEWIAQNLKIGELIASSGIKTLCPDCNSADFEPEMKNEESGSLENQIIDAIKKKLLQNHPHSANHAHELLDWSLIHLSEGSRGYAHQNANTALNSIESITDFGKMEPDLEVFKMGPTSKWTKGRTEEFSTWGMNQKRFPSLGKTLTVWSKGWGIRGDQGKDFCEDGDSGSAVLNAQGVVVGLLHSKLVSPVWPPSIGIATDLAVIQADIEQKMQGKLKLYRRVQDETDLRISDSADIRNATYWHHFMTHSNQLYPNLIEEICQRCGFTDRAAWPAVQRQVLHDLEEFADNVLQELRYHVIAICKNMDDKLATKTDREKFFDDSYNFKNFRQVFYYTARILDPEKSLDSGKRYQKSVYTKLCMQMKLCLDAPVSAPYHTVLKLYDDLPKLLKAENIIVTSECFGRLAPEENFAIS